MFEESQIPDEKSRGFKFYKTLRTRVKNSTERERRIEKFFLNNNLYSVGSYKRSPPLRSSSTPEGDKNGDDFLATTIIYQDKEVLWLIFNYFETARIFFDTDFYGKKTTAFEYASKHNCNESAATITEWTQNHTIHNSLLKSLERTVGSSYFAILRRCEALLTPREAQGPALNLPDQIPTQVITSTTQTTEENDEFFDIFSALIDNLPIKANLPLLPAGTDSNELLFTPLLFSDSNMTGRLAMESSAETGMVMAVLHSFDHTNHLSPSN
jgi:hypothetical protein